MDIGKFDLIFRLKQFSTSNLQKKTDFGGKNGFFLRFEQFSNTISQKTRFWWKIQKSPLIVGSRNSGNYHKIVTNETEISIRRPAYKNMGKFYKKGLQIAPNR